MGFLVTVIAIAAVVSLVLAALQRQRIRQLDAADGLAHAAELLAGRLQADPRAPQTPVVLFDEGPQTFRLFRETRPVPGGQRSLCIVEADAASYQGPELDLYERSAGARTLPPGHQPLELGEAALDGRVQGSCPTADIARVQALLDDAELRRLIGYALDHQAARLHLSPRGSWFECAGFPDSGELIAATARTAVRALAALLERARVS